MTLEKMQQIAHLFQTNLAQAPPHCTQNQFPKTFEEI
jgi:hypothetical protein